MESPQQPGNQVPLTGGAPVSLRWGGRRPDQMRPIHFQNGVAPNALGSTLVQWGRTHVICAVSVEDTIPRWMKEQGIEGGWITAEYSMLPYSTTQRKPREISRGKIEGRTQEIQRLIGRAMRAAVDLTQLGSRTLWIDCDVLQADGGTRTASITGSFVALSLAVQRLIADGMLGANPITSAVAAVSVGIVHNHTLLDLDYVEDSSAEVDLNLVMTSRGEFVELQGTGEKGTFSEAHLGEMLRLGREGIARLIAFQTSAIEATL